MLFSLQDIETAIDADTLSNGRRLLATDRVDRPNVQRGGELVSGMILQGRGQLLRVYIRVFRQTGGDVSIRGECTCRKRSGCEHVAAVLLLALEREQTEDSGGQQAASRQLERAPEPVVQKSVAGKDLPCLVYVLRGQGVDGSRSHALAADELRVETYTARRRPAGGYTEVRSYAPAWMLRGLPPRFLTAADLEVLRHLAGLDPQGSGALTLTQGKDDLQRRYPDAEFALPETLEVRELPLSAPIPCLRLQTHPIADARDRQPVDRAQLVFEYHGRRLGRSDPSSWVDARGLLRVVRDRAAERACIEHMMAAGFVEDSHLSRHTGSDCFNLPGQRQAWIDFQLSVMPALQAAGWRVECAAGFRHCLARHGNWLAELEACDEDGWFGFSIGVETEAGRINLLPALVQLIQEAPEQFTRERLIEPDRNKPIPVPLPDGRLLAVDAARLRSIFETLFELYEPGGLDRAGRLRLHRFQLARLAELEEESALQRADWLVGDELRRRIARLRSLSGSPQVAPPLGLRAVLRKYQRGGLNWLQSLRSGELAGILADDMGLGKTLQTLAHLLLEKEQGRLQHPALVVAPTSLMLNWRQEARRFAPDLRVLTLHGPQRHEHFEHMAGYDLVLTTYPLLVRDREHLLTQSFHILVLDEAQVIKNPRTRVGGVVREIHAVHRLCLTGTPMENHLGELWSLFDFLLPGLLGTQKQFKQLFRVPIEKARDDGAAQRLARRIRPFMLRRTKSQVVCELPPKTEITRSVELEGAQRDLYESIRLAMHERVRREVEDKGLARSGIVILDSLLKLRQVCCDPRLVKLNSARGVRESAKLELLMTLLPEMVAEGRRILLFSQFTGMLALIGQALREAGLDYLQLTGSTRDRATPVERFQAAKEPVFLISLKAGGVGLNLTTADTVIHYDPWWNPAVERQATDRAHRIGQDKAVFVYKLLSEGTVEQRIQALQMRKQALADGLLESGAVEGPQWRAEDLEFLFEPLA